jgi:SAM-dependent methyltransferase
MTTPENLDPIYESKKNMYATPEEAERYNRKHGRTKKDVLEEGCLLRGLADVPEGSLVLDMPCGTGKLIHFLRKQGYRVCGCDSSDNVLAVARKRYVADSGESLDGNPDVVIEQQDGFNLTYSDDHFDAVVCNRLLHHFHSPDTRRALLTELTRVSRGPVVISFFCSESFSAIRFRIKSRLKGENPTSRIPIPLDTLKADIEACGLRLDAVYYTKRWISSQTYVKLSRA